MRFWRGTPAARQSSLHRATLQQTYSEFQGSPDRLTFQLYRKMGSDGLRQVEHTMGDRVHSEALDCWFRVLGEGHATCLRIATGPGGDALVPTFEELGELERSAREQALLRVAVLEAELLQRKG